MQLEAVERAGVQAQEPQTALEQTIDNVQEISRNLADLRDDVDLLTEVMIESFGKVMIRRRLPKATPLPSQPLMDVGLLQEANPGLHHVAVAPVASDHAKPVHHQYNKVAGLGIVPPPSHLKSI